MARPQKEGLDYFPHDVDMDQDDKVIMVIAKFGMEGYGILTKLMQQLYKERGYFMEWTERERLVFKNRINVDINTLDGVINEGLRWGFFHSGMYEKYHILTSTGFQKRYIEATKRRKEVPLIRQYVLVDIDKMIDQFKTPIKLINVNENEVNVDINQVIEDLGTTESTQSKEKVNRNKSNKQYISLEDMEHVLITHDEFEKLVVLYESREAAIDALYRYASWILTQPEKIQKSRSPYLTLRNWHSRDKDKLQGVINSGKVNQSVNKGAATSQDSTPQGNVKSGWLRTKSNADIQDNMRQVQ